MHSRAALARDVEALGVRAGDVVMVHASVRAVGAVAGGPDQIHLALKDAVGSAGTLMMYAGCPRHADEIGRGHLTAQEERELLEKLPVFDARTARADRENGTLVEFFRTWPGTIVNDHVIRFAASGRHAPYLTSSQPWDYAYGRGTALDRLVELDGRIVLLGCDHDNVTFLHHAEHIADIPDRRVARFKVPVLEQGARVWRDMEEFDSAGAGAHANWPPRFFARIVDTFLRKTGNGGGRVGGAAAFLLEARALLDFTLPVMAAVAADAAAADRVLLR